MLLTIDIGNNQTVLGLYGDDDEVAEVGAASVEGSGRCEAGLISHWRASTARGRTADEHAGRARIWDGRRRGVTCFSRRGVEQLGSSLGS